MQSRAKETIDTGLIAEDRKSGGLKSPLATTQNKRAKRQISRKVKCDRLEERQRGLSEQKQKLQSDNELLQQEVKHLRQELQLVQMIMTIKQARGPQQKKSKSTRYQRQVAAPEIKIRIVDTWRKPQQKDEAGCTVTSQKRKRRHEEERVLMGTLAWVRIVRNVLLDVIQSMILAYVSDSSLNRKLHVQLPYAVILFVIIHRFFRRFRTVK